MKRTLIICALLVSTAGLAQEKLPGMALIPAGSFEMGDHHGFVDPKHGSDEIPLHTVRLDSFYIGINDVTTKEYCEFLNAMLAQRQVEVRNGGVYLTGGSDLLCDTRESSPSTRIGWDGKQFSVLDKKENHPMVCVRWHGAAVYCNWLSARKQLPACYNTTTWECDFNKSGFRLPTEPEWEYAARGGQQNPYYNYPWGNDADPAKANVPESKNPFRAGPKPSAPPAGYKAASGPPGQAWRIGAQPLTTPVGFFNGKLQHKADFDWPGDQESFQTANGANGFGLYDMAGNVWQWCTEWYERNYYAYSPAENPPGPAEGSPMADGKAYRCMRGGSWFNGEFGHSRVSNRDPSFYRGPDPVTGLSDADGPWFHIGFRVLRPINAESRPVIKPTPVQRIAGRDGAPGGGRPGQGGGGGRPSNDQARSGDDRPTREGQGGGDATRRPGGFNLLPPRAQEQLNLTDDQRKQLADLETEAKAKLNQILTPEQQQILLQSRSSQRQGGNGGASLNAADSAGNRPARPDRQNPGRTDGSAVERKPGSEIGSQQPRNATSGVTAERKSGFVLRSPEMTDGGTMPKEFTGDGAAITPPLEWSGAPAGTKSYAIIMHHTNARGENISYWVLYNIPAEVQSLPKDVKGVGTPGINSRGHNAGYAGPHSAGPGARTYVFTLYALSAPPQITTAPSEVTHEILLAAMKEKILASADLSVSHTHYTVTGTATGQSDNPQRQASARDGDRNQTGSREDRPPRDSNDQGGQRADQSGDRPQRSGNRQGDQSPDQRDSRPMPETRNQDSQRSDQTGDRPQRNGNQQSDRDPDQRGPRPMTESNSQDGQRSDQAGDRSQRGNRQGGQGDAGGGERRSGGGGGGGRVAENNKTPTSPNPGQTVGVFLNTPKSYDGYLLMAPKHNTNIFLVNNAGQIVHQWKSTYYPGQSVYLKPNGNLLHPCMTRNRSFTGGGEGGRIEEYDWSGKLIWEFPYSTDKYQQHHDIAPMPNGNILLLVVEKKTAADCIAAGWPAEMVTGKELYPEAVVEIQPIYPNSGKVVWEWRVWEHLVQDYDKAKANYGDVAAHPELIYLRGGRNGPTAFWNHANSIAYNAKLDQIVISARGNSEIWFIDHSTTTQESAGHAGGKHGKGGDLIYRWGNPSAYKRGSERDAQLNQQHDAEWVPDGSPGAGHITIFNNGYNRGYTSIEEIVPPVDANGHYILESGKPYGPEKPVWHYEAKNRTDFFSSEISGAHRLPNGNTLICAGVIGHLFEVNPVGEMVWQYVNPVVRGGILAQGELPGKDVRGHLFNAVFKAHRYSPDYPGLAGRDLTPQGVIELPADQKGKTGFDQADAQPGEHPPDAGGQGGGGSDRDGQRGGGRGGSGGGNRRDRPPER